MRPTGESVLAQLRQKGKEATAKIYRRHGVAEETLGVSYADLGAFARKLGTDHALALELWRTGVHDARVLATQVADPAKLARDELDRWVGGAANHVAADAVASAAARSPFALAVAQAWSLAKDEWRAATGFSVYAILATTGRLDASAGAALRERIEAGIAAAPNRVRHAMNGSESREPNEVRLAAKTDRPARGERASRAPNGALIAVGGGIAALREDALGVAARVGPVVVDHGETGCKTPDAADYIRKIAARRARPATKRRKGRA